MNKFTPEEERLSLEEDFMDLLQDDDFLDYLLMLERPLHLLSNEEIKFLIKGAGK